MHVPVDFITRDLRASLNNTNLPAGLNNTDLPAALNNTDLPPSLNNTDQLASLNNTGSSYFAYEIKISNILATCASSQPSLSPPFVELKGIPWG